MPKHAVSPRLMASTIALTIVAGLAIDQHGGVFGQPAVSVWVWLLFAGLVWWSPPTQRPALIACLLFATFGEVVFALWLRYYDYRQGNLPLFVPPGHVLLFWLGIYLSERLPDGLLRAVPWLAIVGVTGLALAGLDWLSVPLLLLYLACWRFGPAPRLYSTMFITSLAMELWGTWLGNWTWQAQVPGLGWPTLNPPLAAGALYCLLDCLVQQSTRRWQAARHAG